MRMPPCTIRCATACFGGRGFKYSDVTQGVWVLSLSAAPSWSRLDVAGKQPKRAFGHCAIYDPVADRMVVHGAFFFGEPEPETWVLPLSDRSTWSRLEIPEPRPTGRTGHTAIFDPARQRMIIYGGTTSPEPYLRALILEDVWSLALGTA